MRIGGLGINKAAQQSNTSEIQKSAKKTVQKAMTDGYIEQIKEMAKRDAQNGTYMSDEFLQVKQARKKAYISPNRSGLQGQVMSIMQRAATGGSRGSLLMRLLGGYSMKAFFGACPQYNTAEVYASNGELVGAYTSGGQWIEMPTEAESKFLAESDSVYFEAYRTARAEMNAASQATTGSSGAGMDLRV